MRRTQGKALPARQQMGVGHNQMHWIFCARLSRGAADCLLRVEDDTRSLQLLWHHS